MAKAQFEYDEQATYYLWPSSKKKDADSTTRCNCDGCIVKEGRRNKKQPFITIKNRIVQGILFAAWLGLFYLSYKVISLKIEQLEYDPYKILGIDPESTLSEIKKQYRKLSLEHHPDRGGDAKMFVEISKAYTALTDDDVRENWQKYGNPDGPGLMRFGIALPSWLVDKAYSYWVLAAYFLVFMVILPVSVGVWWYRSIKYSADQVLLDTTQLYRYFFHRTEHMLVKRILWILGASVEFDSSRSKDCVQRPSDETDVPWLIKEVKDVQHSFGENNKERPLCFPPSLKARALIYAHLLRLPLPEDTLEFDKQFILRKTPVLIQEMISVVAWLVTLANARQIARMPKLETMENVMKTSPMIVQAIWENRSPLLQLPHITDEIVRHCVTKKRHIRCCADLANMSDNDRKQLLRSLDEVQYANVMTILSTMPNISMDVRVEVQDDEDKQTITAGALVTVFVKLTRRPLSQVTNATVAMPIQVAQDDAMPVEDEHPTDEDQMQVEKYSSEQAATTATKIWDRNKKKKSATKTQHKNKKKPPPPRQIVVQRKPLAANGELPAIANGVEKTDRKEEGENNDEQSVENGDEDEGSDSELDTEAGGPSGSGHASADDDDFLDEEISRKERILEAKSKITHPVHCPYFPEEKYEWWWIYLCDRKQRRLWTPPQLITSLVTEEEVELKFPAPDKTGQYTLQVCLRSDSYLDCDQVKDIKFEVHPAKEVPVSHPQWDFAADDEEKEQGDEEENASEYTEDEVGDDED